MNQLLEQVTIMARHWRKDMYQPSNKIFSSTNAFLLYFKLMMMKISNPKANQFY